jgi:histidyl-tRNA synthetase
MLGVTTDALTAAQAEFQYKHKPKLQAQFKLAEQGGIPFAVVLGEDEQAQGKVKIKEMGLPDGHPEKEGVLVDLKDLVPEVRVRLQQKAEQGAVEHVTSSTSALVLEAPPASG